MSGPVRLFLGVVTLGVSITGVSIECLTSCDFSSSETAAGTILTLMLMLILILILILLTQLDIRVRALST